MRELEIRRSLNGGLSPTSRCATVSAEMQAGTYRVVGRANAANVLPSYSQWQLAGAALIRFYVQ